MLVATLLGGVLWSRLASPSITLNPNRGRGGTHVTVDGSNFPQSGMFAIPIYVYWDWGLGVRNS